MYELKKPTPIVVCGVPCSGKSTLSRELTKEIYNSFLIDKDIINEAFCGNDRTGHHYKTNVRNQSYLTILMLAKANLFLGKSPILDVPYIKEIKSCYFENVLIPLLGVPKIVLCYANEDVIKKRLTKRGLEIDKEKLYEDGWKKFLLEEPIMPVEIEKYDHIKIDTEIHVEGNMEKIINYLMN